MHMQMNAAFTDFFGNIKAYHLAGAYHSKPWNTDFYGGVFYFDYGKTMLTDATGNIYGDFRPADFVVQVSASRTYLDRWRYGATIKFINSSYGIYRANGIAVDGGIVYQDTSKMFSASLVVKNIGTPLKKYTEGDVQDMPFDLELGISKRLAHAPFEFSLTAQRLQRFDISYNDTAFDNTNGFPVDRKTGFTFDKMFRHIVLATTLYIGEQLSVSAGYNHLRRKELSIGNGSNGLNGFSVGVGADLVKFEIKFGRAWYQSQSGFNQLGINLRLERKEL
jgi:hypothetical protein